VSARGVHHSYDDYLSALEASELKLEYCDGEIYAMAGGTPLHAELSAAVIGLLRQSFEGRCKVYSSDLKVRCEPSDLSTFPDATVICGDPAFSPLDKNAAVNPSLLVEITSASTEDYDRGEKLSHYKQLPSVQAVLFVSHKAPRITLVQRKGAGWSSAEFRAGEQLSLAAPACTLAVDDLYRGIALP
jgi:Uma2 family endonuclease